MAVTGYSVDVVIGEEKYSPTEVPPVTSALVVAGKADLLGSTDFEILVYDSLRTGKSVRVACNIVTGNTDLQITLQEMAYSITKLYNKAAITALTFTTTSHSVVFGLRSSYMYLLDNELEEMVFDDYSTLRGTAAQIAQTAKELSNAFEIEERKICQILEKVQRSTQPTDHHNLKVALKHLCLILLSCANFWKQMSNCNSSFSYVQDMVEQGMKYSEEKRLKIWMSRAFRRVFLRVLARWVALEDLCSTYSKSIKAIQEELYTSIQDNPTPEESHTIVSRLAADILAN